MLTSRLRIIKELGAGGQAVVYEVEDVESSQHFAAKVLRRSAPTPTQMTRLLREAEAVARVAHPNVARMYGVERADDGRPFVLMELLVGESLDKLIAQGPLQIGWACQVALDVANAVAAAHAAG